MKELLRRILKVILSPVRWNYRQRNGVASQEPRKEIPNDILLGMARDMICEGHTATIAVKGYSMRPFLEHCRDRVILASPDSIKIGDAILAEIDTGHYVLHRIIGMEGDAITLMGDGNIRGTEHCQKSDVAGVVTHYIRPNRVILASDPKLVRRIKLWRRLLPIRRYLLFIYKACI